MFYEIFTICKIYVLDTGLYPILNIIIICLFYIHIFNNTYILYINVICLHSFYYK